MKRILSFIACTLVCSSALAHQGSQAYLDLAASGDKVTITLRATVHDLAPTLNVAAGVNPLPALYRSKQETVLQNVAAYLTLVSGQRHRCGISRRDLRIEKDKWVKVRLTYACPRRVELLELRYDLLFDIDPRHRAFITVAGDPAAQKKVLSSSRRTFRLERDVSAWTNAADFFVLGIEHIFTGYDHLIFLLGLLLVAGVSGRQGNTPRGLRPGLIYLLKIVTSFTVAHSLTLLLAALEVLTLPSRVVEPAIALSIIYVGAENLLRGDPKHRWLLTFAFGLVHGFGFAHVLRDIGLPRSGLILSLFSFNLGVEVGQVAVVSLLFPLVHLLAREVLSLAGIVLLVVLLGLLLGLLALAGVQVATVGPAAAVLLALGILGVRRWGYRAVMLQGGSAIITLLGLIWLIERLWDISLLDRFLA